MEDRQVFRKGFGSQPCFVGIDKRNGRSRAALARPPKKLHFHSSLSDPSLAQPIRSRQAAPKHPSSCPSSEAHVGHKQKKP
jgi:hypothetical protein